MLTLKQNNEVNRANRLKMYLVLNLLIFTAFKPFKKVYDKFLLNYDKLQDEAKKKNQHDASITDKKKALKKKIASVLGLILSTTLEYAKEVNDTILMAKVNFSDYDIEHMKDGDLLNFVLQLQKNVYTDALFSTPDFMESEITKADIDAVILDATAFHEMIGLNKELDSESTIANNNMDLAITAIHQNILSFDNLIGKYLTTNPDFVSGYYINSALESIGTRHEGMEGFVYKNGVPVKGAIVRIVGTEKFAVTDSTGHYVLIRIKPDTYSVLASTEAGDSETKSVVVRYKHIDTVDFHLA